MRIRTPSAQSYADGRRFAFLLRTFALAAAAFLARAIRSAGVIFSAARIPPSLPAFAAVFRESSRKYLETPGGTFFRAMMSIA